MATPTVEQYLKTILLIERRTGREIVPMKALADAMGVTAGTATAMAKHLADECLIAYRPRQGTSLTEAGRLIATTIVRRHRLIETFLERTLGYDWTEVHSEAEELEHVVSDLFVQRIDALLGFPDADPHGDPIPRADGHFEPRRLVSLGEVEDGAPVEVAQLVDTDAEALNNMKRMGMVPGRRFRVVRSDAAAGTITVSDLSDESSLVLSLETAERVRVIRAYAP